MSNYVPRLKKVYTEQIMPELKKEFNCKFLGLKKS